MSDEVMSPFDLTYLYDSYLEHSYRYYNLDEPIISDYEFDTLCKRLLDRWDELKHPFKHLTDESALEAGTGFQLYHKIPDYIKGRVREQTDD